MSIFRFHCTLLFFLFCSVYMTGCAGQVQPYVPSDLPKVTPGKARIVLTRQSQFASPGPYVFFDIGDNIVPNALLSGRVGAIGFQKSSVTMVPNLVGSFRGSMMPVVTNAGVELKETGVTLDTLVKENIDQSFFIDLLWCDPATFRTLSCGKEGKGCKSSCEKGFVAGDIAMVWDTGIALGMKGNFYKEIKKASGDNKGNVLPPEIMNYIESFNMDSIKKDELNKVVLFRDRQGFSSPDHEATLAFTKTIGKKIFKKPSEGGSWDAVHKYVSILDNRQIHRNVEVVGSLQPERTLIWERDPGILRLGTVCENLTYGSVLSPHNIEVEAGRIYYIDFQVKPGRGAFWTLAKTE